MRPRTTRYENPAGRRARFPGRRLVGAHGLVLALALARGPALRADAPLPGHVRVADILAQIQGNPDYTPQVKTFLDLMVRMQAQQDKIFRAQQILEKGEGTREDVEQAGETMDRHRIDPILQNVQAMESPDLDLWITQLRQSEKAKEKELKSLVRKIR